MQRPTIICLCGSTRFYPAFQEANFRETLDGKIVLSVRFYPHAQNDAHGEDKGITPEQKRDLDNLHLREIDLADEILMLNVGVTSEIRRAEKFSMRSQTRNLFVGLSLNGDTSLKLRQRKPSNARLYPLVPQHTSQPDSLNNG